MDDVQDEHYAVLVEFDNENVTEFRNVVEGLTSGEGGVNVPVVGLLFKDENDMYEFYEKYAFVVDFPVKKWNSKKEEDDGVVRYVTLTYYYPNLFDEGGRGM